LFLLKTCKALNVLVCRFDTTHSLNTCEIWTCRWFSRDWPIDWSPSSLVLRQISSNGHHPLPPECHGLVD